MKINQQAQLVQLFRAKKIKDMDSEEIMRVVDKAQDLLVSGDIVDAEMANEYLEFMKSALDIIFIAQEIAVDEQADQGDEYGEDGSD